MDGSTAPIKNFAVGDKVRVVVDPGMPGLNKGKPILNFVATVCNPPDTNVPAGMVPVAGIMRDKGVEDPVLFEPHTVAPAVVKIVLPGNISPYSERTVIRGDGKIGSRTATKTQVFQAACRMYGEKAMIGLPMIVGPVQVTEVFYQPVPKSWSACDKADALRGFILPHSRPDRTNVIKAYEDGFTNIVWTDDSRIAKWAGARFFSDRPRMEITIEALGAQRMRKK